MATLLDLLEGAEADAQHGADKALADGLPTLEGVYRERASGLRDAARRLEAAMHLATGLAACPPETVDVESFKLIRDALERINGGSPAEHQGDER